MKHKKIDRSKQWPVLILTVLGLGSISIVIFWLFFNVSLSTLIEIAFIFYLLVYAGWKRSISSILIIVSVCLIIYWFMWLTENPEYESGVTAFENKDYKTAVEKLEQVIAIERDHYDAYYLLCMAKSKQGRFKEALSACNTAIQLDYPVKSESHNARARVYVALKQPDKAIHDYTISLNFFKSWYVLWERCRMYNRINQYDNAINDCKASLELNDKWYDPWWPLGNAYYKKNDFKNALRAYENYQRKAEKTPDFMQKRISEIKKRLF